MAGPHSPPTSVAKPAPLSATLSATPSQRRRVLVVIGLGVLARLAIGATIGLGVDESYALAVARPVSWSYYDHPPLVFWMTALAEHVVGAGHDVLLRLPFIVLFGVTTWLLYRLTAHSFGERAGLFAAILVTVIPVFGVADGGWMLPDAPLIFAFAAAALCLSHIASSSSEADARIWWAGLAAATGMAALAKYHAVFLVAGIVTFVVTSQQQRRWLTRPEPYLAAVAATAMSLPVLLWNASHSWVSFRFQLGRSSAQRGAHVISLLQNLGGQAGYILPWVWIPLAWLLIAAARNGPRDTSRWLLVCLGGGTILVFTIVAFTGSPGLPHWPAPGWLLILPLLGDALARLERRGRGRAVRVYLAATACAVVLLVSIAATQIATGWVSRALPQLFTRGDPSLDALDWREVRAALADSTRTPGRQVVVAADWIDAAKLGAALAPDATVLCFNDDQRQFQFVADQRALVGGDALVVLRSDPRSTMDEDRRRISSYFRRVDSVTTIPIHRAGRDAIRIVVYRATALTRPYASSEAR